MHFQLVPFLGECFFVAFFDDFLEFEKNQPKSKSVVAGSDWNAFQIKIPCDNKQKRLGITAANIATDLCYTHSFAILFLNLFDYCRKDAVRSSMVVLVQWLKDCFPWCVSLSKGNENLIHFFGHRCNVCDRLELAHLL